MSPLLAPVLAQLISLHVADRTEARYLNYDNEIYEASTSPAVQLALGWKRSDVTLGYAPSITVSPLEEQPRTLAIYHTVNGSAGYRWRQSALTFTSTLGFGSVNFQVAGLQGQPPPLTGAGQQPPAAGEVTPPGPVEPTPGNPANGQLEFHSQYVRYYATTTTLSFTHVLSKHLQSGAHLGQMRAGGLDAESSQFYPALQSYFAGLHATYDLAVSSADSFGSNVSLDGAWSSSGSTAINLNASEAWNHKFDPHTFTGVSAGANGTRFTQDTGLRGFSLYPSFHAWLAHDLRFWGGSLKLGIYAYSGPTFDPLRAIVDPRVGAGGNVTYTRKRFSIGVDGSAAISVNSPDHDVGSIDSAQGQGITSYRINDGVSMDAGVRVWRQAVQEQLVIPTSWSVFLGLTLADNMRLSRGH